MEEKKVNNILLNSYILKLIGMEEDRRNKEKSEGYNVSEAEKYGTITNERRKTKAERIRRENALREKPAT